MGDANETLPHLIDGDTQWMQMSPSPTFTRGRRSHAVVDANRSLGDCWWSKVEVKSGTLASSTKHHHQLQMWEANLTLLQ